MHVNYSPRTLRHLTRLPLRLQLQKLNQSHLSNRQAYHKYRRAIQATSPIHQHSDLPLEQCNLARYPSLQHSHVHINQTTLQDPWRVLTRILGIMLPQHRHQQHEPTSRPVRTLTRVPLETLGLLPPHLRFSNIKRPKQSRCTISKTLPTTTFHPTFERSFNATTLVAFSFSPHLQLT